MMFALTIQTVYLVMMMMVMMIYSGISTCDVEATHDAVAEICRKQVI